ncbi:hypothetical protein VOLCADRAFT_93019 [Volvox carteri f. nagariensis]|uniref:Uncharacterized protein n=1 Tax=Volvox carteri f. nagariensis TaxID=3068 RepID=D8U147_VOLCA|nr:uncharacterized protein VOLCADRAFT_93019 [Volvox carteri f. nagariensis]EFJ46568.1 hypothetical protein VOLCADRAFT_93019 [Volvox carteri f. nagariensis]|eukprot:XP_002952425.1 hypothetical protein VOLCADRAFT_93019 [Volvox carteri f. nagariensis]
MMHVKKGNCGNGPNMVLLPEEQLLHHVATPKELAQLRLAGNAYAARHDFSRAIDCYSCALQLNPPAGAHMLYSNRSASYLQVGDMEAALEDAQRAVELAPPGFHNAAIRLIDALFALRRFEEAAEACRGAAERDSSFRFREEYPVIKDSLKRLGHAV